MRLIVNFNMLHPKTCLTDPGVPVNLYRTIPVNPICAVYSIYGYRVPDHT